MAQQPRMAPGADPFQRQLITRQRTEREQFRPTQSLIIHGPDETTVGTAATTLYTAPEERFFLVEEMTVTNITAGTETFDIHFVPNGGTAGTGNAVIYQEQIATATSLRIATLSGLFLEPQGAVQAKTSTVGGINITFWGIEVEGI